MSFAKKCDRCGTYHDGLINRLTTTGHTLLDEHEYDLCDECRDEFEDFMNGVKPKDLLSRLRALIK